MSKIYIAGFFDEDVADELSSYPMERSCFTKVIELGPSAEGKVNDIVERIVNNKRSPLTDKLWKELGEIEEEVRHD